MKLARVLRKIRLYEPLKNLADKVRITGDAVADSLKSFRYRWLLVHSHERIKPSCGKPEVLVVLTSGGIGNSIEGTPLVQALRALWPQAVITVVAPLGDLFETWCVPDRIVQSGELIRGHSFDHTFFPYPFLNAIEPWKKICALGRIHHPKVWRRKYFLKSDRQYSLDMLKRIGYKGIVPPLYVSIKEPRFEIGNSQWRICLVPGAQNSPKWRHKRWPFFAELAAMLSDAYPEAQLCIIGTHEDPFENGGQVTDLRGRLSLAETAWVLKHSRLAIGNDCGPMHIAYAVGTPSIVIFGPTCDIKNPPSGKAVGLKAGLRCQPCQYSDLIETCPDARCMRELSPCSVMKTVAELLSKRDEE